MIDDGILFLLGFSEMVLTSYIQALHNVLPTLFSSCNLSYIVLHNYTTDKATLSLFLLSWHA